MIVLLFLLSACSTALSNNSAASQPTDLPPQQCGAVMTFRSIPSSMNQTMAKGAEDCFWQAFQQCQSATLTFTQSDSEASTIHTFALSSEQGSCKVTDQVQHFSPTHMPQSPTTYTCTSMQKHADGLHILSCGPLGTILIPTVGTKE